MKIVLSGIETNNKGAELMLYAILQEIERKWPDAEVYIPYARCLQGLNYVKTSLDLRYTPFSNFFYKTHLGGILMRLHLPKNWMHLKSVVKDCDWFIDGSGFAFSDRFNITDGGIKVWKMILEKYDKQGTKIVFLPQAFGPFEKVTTKKLLSVILQYATVVMPREKVSLKYIEETGLANDKKVQMYTDFTSLVEGVFPEKYDSLRNGVCIIPNKQMINKGAITLYKYLDLLKSIILISKKSGRVVYLLNHEGKKDEQLCRELQKLVPDGIEYVSGLNALEVKGLISTAYIVISSRFHGVASALNTCVPCLATSWSHKYKELFSDYAMSDCVLPLDNVEMSLEKISDFMVEDNNQIIRNKLNKEVPHIKEETRKMWNTIWSL